MTNSPELERIYIAIGAALHRWSRVESQLATLFTTLIDSQDGTKAMAAFEGVVSFDVRLSLCNTLMKYEQLDELDKEIWRLLTDRLMKSYRKRHEVAHFALISYNDGPSLIAPFVTATKINEGKQKSLTPEQVAERAEKFLNLFHALFWTSFQAKCRRKDQRCLEQDFQEPPLVAQLRILAARNIADTQLRSTKIVD